MFIARAKSSTRRGVVGDLACLLVFIVEVFGGDCRLLPNIVVSILGNAIKEVSRTSRQRVVLAEGLLDVTGRIRCRTYHL
jgi:hypothetical protein